MPLTAIFHLSLQMAQLFDTGPRQSPHKERNWISLWNTAAFHTAVISLVCKKKKVCETRSQMEITWLVPESLQSPGFNFLLWQFTASFNALAVCSTKHPVPSLLGHIRKELHQIIIFPFYLFSVFSLDLHHHKKIFQSLPLNAQPTVIVKCIYTQHLILSVPFNQDDSFIEKGFASLSSLKHVMLVNAVLSI